MPQGQVNIRHPSERRFMTDSSICSLFQVPVLLKAIPQHGWSVYKVVGDTNGRSAILQRLKPAFEPERQRYHQCIMNQLYQGKAMMTGCMSVLPELITFLKYGCLRLISLFGQFQKNSTVSNLWLGSSEKVA